MYHFHPTATGAVIRARQHPVALHSLVVFFVCGRMICCCATFCSWNASTMMFFGFASWLQNADDCYRDQATCFPTRGWTCCVHYWNGNDHGVPSRIFWSASNWNDWNDFCGWWNDDFESLSCKIQSVRDPGWRRNGGAKCYCHVISKWSRNVSWTS